MKAKLNNLGLIGFVVLGLLATGTTGCKESRNTTENTTVDRAVGEKSRGEEIDDKAISSRVKDALNDNAAYKFPEVTVATHKATVQLSGFVATKDQKSAAEDIVRKIAGVKNVENKITVKQ